MKDTIKKVLNIYVVSGFIGLLVIFYLISFIMLQIDISNGSSLKMEKEQMRQEKK